MGATYREWEGLVIIVALGVIDDSSRSLRCKGLVNSGSKVGGVPKMEEEVPKDLVHLNRVLYNELRR